MKPIFNYCFYKMKKPKKNGNSFKRWNPKNSKRNKTWIPFMRAKKSKSNIQKPVFSIIVSQFSTATKINTSCRKHFSVHNLIKLKTKIVISRKQCDRGWLRPLIYVRANGFPSQRPKPKMSDLDPKWIRLAQNRTNPGLFRSDFSTFWLI